MTALLFRKVEDMYRPDFMVIRFSRATNPSKSRPFLRISWLTPRGKPLNASSMFCEFTYPGRVGNIETN